MHVVLHITILQSFKMCKFVNQCLFFFFHLEAMNAIMLLRCGGFKKKKQILKSPILCSTQVPKAVKHWRYNDQQGGHGLCLYRSYSQIGMQTSFLENTGCYAKCKDGSSDRCLANSEEALLTEACIISKTFP